MIAEQPVHVLPADHEAEAGTSLWRDAWHRLRKNKMAVTSAAVLIVLVLMCVSGPWFTHNSYEEQNLSLGATPPSAAHWLGTDELGRDQLTRLLYGGRISLMVGVLATLVALFIGVTYGAISGYAGGKLDVVMMRIVDIMYALPFTIFVILLMVFFGDAGSKVEHFLNTKFDLGIKIGGHWNLLLLFAAIGAVEWLTMARIVRGQVQSLRKKEFIEAVQALGLRPTRIIFRHVIPNILGPVIVYATLTVPAVMLLEAFLSFLGLGVQPPMSSWGSMIKDGADRMEEFPWMLIFPGMTLAITLFCLNFLGDGLRDALDVRASKD